MTKAEFFKLCDGADPEYPLSVGWQMETRGLDRVVYLSGSLCGGCLNAVELYRPQHNRQHENYTRVVELLEKATRKFQRWLEEWQQHQQQQPENRQ